MIINTVFSENFALWFKTKNTTQEGIKDLPAGTYIISLKYQNDVFGLANNGLPITDKDHIKSGDNIFTGILISNSVEIIFKK
ncbi:MAG: hypothetical protein K8S27_10460 [Candidatus Omnitrophica bacterium]|nr:hypothetical protein [Candidatus Omnitrophota bacterium]